jgi:hypothetical protein
MVSFRESPLVHQRERNGPAEGFGGAGDAHAIVGAHGQAALYVAQNRYCNLSFS